MGQSKGQKQEHSWGVLEDRNNLSVRRLSGCEPSLPSQVDSVETAVVFPHFNVSIINPPRNEPAPTLDPTAFSGAAAEKMATTAVLPSLHVHTSVIHMRSGSPPLSLGDDQKFARCFAEPRRLQFRAEDGRLISTVSVKPWDTLDELRDLLTQDLQRADKNSTSDRVRLFFRGHELAYKRTVDSNNLQDMDVIHVKSAQNKGNTSKPRLEVLCGSVCPNALVPILEAARDGLERGLSPELTPSGLGGTYFLKNGQKEIVGVFKPADEEAFTPNNPKGNTGEMGGPSVRNGVHSGEANLREVAAYMLDHQKFANVPATVRVEMKHKIFGDRAKVG